MIRSFLPVGQGAFYRELFSLEDGIHTIIYDCGSSTAQSIVEQQIKDEFKIGEVIDAVFISHLHEDHMNGCRSCYSIAKLKTCFFHSLLLKIRFI